MHYLVLVFYLAKVSVYLHCHAIILYLVIAFQLCRILTSVLFLSYLFGCWFTILPICFVKLGLGQFLQIHYNFKCNWSFLKAVPPPFGSPTKTHQWTPTIQQIPCGFLTVNFTQGSIRKRKQFTRMLCEPQLNSIHLIGLLVYLNTQNCLENLHKAFSS